jgi:hypothetical protein
VNKINAIPIATDKGQKYLLDNNQNKLDKGIICYHHEVLKYKKISYKSHCKNFKGPDPFIKG